MNALRCAYRGKLCCTINEVVALNERLRRGAVSGLDECPSLFCDEKVIFIPATERSPAWSNLRVKKGRNGDDFFLGTQWWATLGSRHPRTELVWSFTEISWHAAQQLIDQSRARCKRKMLPQYKFVQTFFRGVLEGMSVDLQLDFVSDGTSSVNGLYATLSAANRGPGTKEELDARLTRLLNTIGKFEEPRSLFELVRADEPDYPYTWDTVQVEVVVHPQCHACPSGCSPWGRTGYGGHTKTDAWPRHSIRVMAGATIREAVLKANGMARDPVKVLVAGKLADLDMPVQSGQTILVAPRFHNFEEEFATVEVA